MNDIPAGKNLRKLFTLLRTTSPARPAYTADEIREMVAKEQTTSADIMIHPHTTGRKAMSITAITLLAGAAAAYIGLAPHSSPDTQSSAAGYPMQGSGAIPRMLPASEDSSASATDTTKNGGKKKKPRTKDATTQRYDSTALVRQIEWHPKMGSHVATSRLTDTMAWRMKMKDPVGKLSAQADAPTAPHSIPGTQLLELTPQELQRIDVTMTGDLVNVVVQDRYTVTDQRIARALASLGYDTTRKGIRQIKVTVGTSSISSETIAAVLPERISPFSPLMISSNWRNGPGTGSALFFVDDAPLSDASRHGREKFSKELDQLISQEEYSPRTPEELAKFPALGSLLPVHIRLKGGEAEGIKQMQESDIYLWYFPTEEFIEALPDRYRVPLRNELKLLAEIQQLHLPTEKACERMTGERSFFDYCRNISGAILGAELSPNPAQGQTLCRITLESPRKTSMALYDINGMFIRDLSGPAPYPAGEHEVTCDLQNVPSGTYLIMIRTEQGEQVVRRVIVKN